MAVYTKVPKPQLEAFLKEYDLGTPVDFQGITQGVENTNYFLTTSKSKYVVTLFEKRVDRNDLPFFIDFMTFLSRNGINAPAPIADRQGEILKTLCDRPTIIISFLDGKDITNPTPADCAAVGKMLARMHLAAEGFAGARENTLGLTGWRTLAQKCSHDADRCADGLSDFIQRELEDLTRTWPDHLPSGVVHADLFPDNVFFKDGALCGVIDFYFSCNDAFAYDLAITLNAWAGDGGWSQPKAAALLKGYQSIRPLSDEEQHALPTLLRGAALRFLLTRLYDWLNQIEGAQVTVKDPLVYRDLLAFHSTQNQPNQTKNNMVEIYTDGACSGNPGPGGWGVLILTGGDEKELYGGAEETTNNRMELLAAIEALKATRDVVAVRLHTDSTYVKNGITQWINGWKRNGWKTAARKPVKNQDLWQALDQETQGREIDWRWVKGHAGNDGNERADELARRGASTLSD